MVVNELAGEICGKDYCRSCRHPKLFSALDLGSLPIANELVRNSKIDLEVFPLHLKICPMCGLGQVEDVVSPERLFSDYRYLSSMSASFVEHAQKFACTSFEEIVFTDTDWVLEIASNDGYLLKHFIDLGVNVLGVEPAKNIANLAKENGIPTVNEFFSSALAETLLESHGSPKLIVANNVMAHVPNLRDFVAGLAVLTGSETVVSIENPSLMNFISGDQFDSIYHEHFSYLTAHSVKWIAANNGLELFRVEEIQTHGGSNRYWLRKAGNRNLDFPDVEVKISREKTMGLLDEDVWKAFAARIQNLIASFHDWVEDLNKNGKILCGFGAAAKASTLINSSQINQKWIRAIADSSPEKQGWFMPTLGIPIVSPQEMESLSPTDIIIFPWNISEELNSFIKQQFNPEIRTWIAVPKIKEME